MDASGLDKDYNTMSKSEIANAYCDAEEEHDEVKLNQYFSALMLKYWYMVPYLAKRNTNLNFEIEDFVFWIAESFSVAFKYKRWRDSSNKLSQDPNAPEKVINRCIYSTEKRWYAYFNKNKRKINYNHDVYSLEESFEIFGDAADAYMQHSNYIGDFDVSHELIQLYLDEDKIINALILDGIANYDTFKTVGDKKTGNYTEFSRALLVKHLNSLDQGYLETFESIYRVDVNKLQQTVQGLIKSRNYKLYNHIDSAINELRNNKEVLNILCS